MPIWDDPYLNPRNDEAKRKSSVNRWLDKNQDNIKSFVYNSVLGYNPEYEYQRLKENERYWNDYRKNTGITPLYPLRANSVVDYGAFYSNVSKGILNLYKKK